MRPDIRGVQLDLEVIDHIKGQSQPGDGINRGLRRIFGMPLNPKKRIPKMHMVQSEHGSYDFLQELSIGQSVTLPWIYTKGIEGEAANAGALRQAVHRAGKRSNHKLASFASADGLIVVRKA